MTRAWTRERYRRLLRWYPAEWRERNEDAVVGMLMEQAHHDGLPSPTAVERRSLLLNGLGERFLQPQATTGPAFIAFALALLYSAWYLSLTTWAPGIHYAGAVWPFSNPTPFAVILLVAAFAAALGRRARLARLLAYSAAAGELIIWALGAGQGWLGPSLFAALVFSGLAVCAGGAPPSRRQLVKPVLALALVLAAAFAAPQIPPRIALLFMPGVFDDMPLPTLLVYVVLPLIALVGVPVLLVSALVLVRSPGSRRNEAREQVDSAG